MWRSGVDAENKMIFLNTIGVLGHTFCFILSKVFFKPNDYVVIVV